MKRVLFLSIVAALWVGACGEKSNLALKARQRQQQAGQQGPQAPKGTGAENDITDVALGNESKAGRQKATPSFTALEYANNLKLRTNQKVTRNVLLYDDPAKLTVLCTENLHLTLKESASLKVLGGGQVLMPQDTESQTPESENTGRTKEATANSPKDVVNILCESRAAGTEVLETEKNIKVLNLPSGKAKELSGKFSDGRNLIQKIRVGCESSERLRYADQLFFGSGQFPLKMLLGPNTSILFETAGGTSKNKKYQLVNCAPPTSSAAKESLPPEETEETDLPDLSAE